LTPSYSTVKANDYGSVIESFLSKKNNAKYDIIFYDNMYTSRYGPYLLDLRELLNETQIEIYDSRILNQSCTYDNHLVGLVI